MAQSEKLKSLPIDDLRRELHARQLKPSEELAAYDDATLVKQVKSNQKVIYGVDDRQDVFDLTQPADLQDVDSVVALFRAGNVTDNGDGTSTLATENFGTSQNLCPGERFRDQPVGAFCSGFLVAADIIATAGHCIDASNVSTVRFVFGFRMLNGTAAQTRINNADIYSGASIIGRQEVATGPDWALVRLDRSVTNHRIAPIRRTGRVPDGQAVHVIGHPVGLPMKFAGGSVVRDNSPAAFFVANLDTYGGNSGSPVFNGVTRQVEGILVRGETDFVAQGGCTVSLVCPTTGCRGEDCTRTTEFANLVPQTGVLVKKAIDDPPVSLKKTRDDNFPPGLTKKAIDDPPASLKKFRDDDVGKKLRDDFAGKPVLDHPFPPIGGGLLPFSLATGHHAKHVGDSGALGAQDQAAALSTLAAVEQQWLDVQAALAQVHAVAAQALAEAGRLEQASATLSGTYAELSRQLGGDAGSGS